MQTNAKLFFRKINLKEAYFGKKKYDFSYVTLVSVFLFCIFFLEPKFKEMECTSVYKLIYINDANFLSIE